MNEFEDEIKEAECKRHKRYDTLAKAAKARSRLTSVLKRHIYIWQCSVCNSYHISKRKKDSDLHKNEIRVNKRGELV